MAKKKYDLDLAVEFGGVSIGETSARIGVRIPREDLNIDAADDAFAGRRLNGMISLQTREERRQKNLDGMEDNTPRTMESVFDVKRFGVSLKDISIGLTFALSEIDVAELAHFAKRSGTLKCSVVGPIPEDEHRGAAA